MNKDRFHTILAETIEWEIRSKVYLSVQTNWETAKKLYDECLDFYHKILLWLLQEEDFSKNQIHKISQKGAESYHSLWFSIEETVKIIVSDSSAERETISYATLQVREKIGTLIIRKPSFYNPNTPISWNSDREWGKRDDEVFMQSKLQSMHKMINSLDKLYDLHDDWWFEQLFFEEMINYTSKHSWIKMGTSS